MKFVMLPDGQWYSVVQRVVCDGCHAHAFSKGRMQHVIVPIERASYHCGLYNSKVVAICADKETAISLVAALDFA